MLDRTGSVLLLPVEETLDSALRNAVDVADGPSNNILAAGAAVFHGACFTTWLVAVVWCAIADTGIKMRGWLLMKGQV